MIINKKRERKILEFLIHILSYAIILQLMAIIFDKTITIDNSYFGLWGLLISFVIYILNKTIKPIIFTLTLPITGLTLGTFYFVINFFIIKLADWMFGNLFNVNNFFLGLLVSIIISLFNLILDELIIKPIIKKEKKYESNISRNR